MPEQRSSLGTSHWRTLQLFYHQPYKDHLLVHGAAPLLHHLRLQGHLQGFFLQRHWQHGPHLRINLHLNALDDETTVRLQLTEGLTHYCEQYPSSVTLTADEYVSRYGKVAGYELVDEPLLPLYGNHQLHWGPLKMRDQMYGSPALAALTRTFLTRAEPLVADLLDDLPTQTQKFMVFARWMFVFSASFESHVEGRYGSVPSVALTFRSHAEAYYHHAQDGEAVRARFEASARNNVHTLRHQLNMALAGTDADVRKLRALFGLAIDQAMALHARGELRVFGRAEYEEALRHLPPGIEEPAGSYSPRHATLTDPDSELSRLLLEPEIQVRRWLVNLLYDRMMTAGCRAVDRFALCELVASTVESTYGLEAFRHPTPRPAAEWSA